MIHVRHFTSTLALRDNGDGRTLVGPADAADHDEQDPAPRLPRLQEASTRQAEMP